MFLIVLSPIIAIFAAHIFSNSLVQQMELRRRPTMREWLALVGSESTLLLLAVPPLAILIVLRLANVALTDAVQLLIWLEALSLIFWAGLAAWHAGLRGRPLALSILGGVAVAAIVLLLQVFLEPGKAVNDGTAAALRPPTVLSSNCTQLSVELPLRALMAAEDKLAVAGKLAASCATLREGPPSRRPFQTIGCFTSYRLPGELVPL